MCRQTGRWKSEQGAKFNPPFRRKVDRPTKSRTFAAFATAAIASGFREISSQFIASLRQAS
jgi:hypothetical protein